MENDLQSRTNNDLPNQPTIVDTKMSGGVKKAKYELDYPSLALFLLLFVAIGTLYYALTRSTVSETATLENEVAAEEQIKPNVNYFDGITLESKSAFVWDMNTDTVLYALNEEKQLPLASITKLMTVVAASEYLSPDDTIVVNNNNLFEEGDSGLLAFEEWNTKDLIDFTLMVSSNDGASVLASAAGAAKIVRSGSQSDLPNEVFVEKMNDLASTLGLRQTYFLNETGLDPTKATSGSYGSARDAALLMGHIVTSNPELVDSTVRLSREIYSLSNFLHVATNTNQSVGNIPGIIASKTGFTDLAGGNLVIAFDAGIGRPIIVSVLGSSLDGRFTDVEKLVAATLLHISQ